MVESPEQLKELEGFAKEGTAAKIAAVWNSARRQGKTTWDGKIVVRFGTEGRERTARVMRKAAKGDEIVILRLKYNPALEWCREKLREEEAQ